MTVRNANFTAFIDAFTNNTFVMVIMGPDSADIGTSLRRPRERHTRGREWGLGWSWGACVGCRDGVARLPLVCCRGTLSKHAHNSFTLCRALSYPPAPPYALHSRMSLFSFSHPRPPPWPPRSGPGSPLPRCGGSLNASCIFAHAVHCLAVPAAQNRVRSSLIFRWRASFSKPM